MSSRIAGINDSHLDTKWSDLGQAQKDKLTAIHGDRAKSAFKNARKQRMAGEAIVSNSSPGAPPTPQIAPTGSSEVFGNNPRAGLTTTQTNGTGGKPEVAPVAPTVTNIDNFDLTAGGAGAHKGTKRLSAADLKNLRGQGFSVDEIVAYNDRMMATGEVKQGGKAQALLEKYKSEITGGGVGNPSPVEQPETPPTPVDPPPVDNTEPPPAETEIPITPPPVETPKPPTIPSIGTGGGTGSGIIQAPDNSQEQTVNQDNDIDTRINGNNNTVVNNQDNSVRQYGGDNRTFAYNGGGGSSGSGSSKYEDTPVSAATMSGFYEVDDSPSAQAKFNDLHTGLNRDNQKRYAGQGLATAAMFGNFDARSYTDESMTNAIYRSTINSQDKADVQTGLTLGDIWRPDYAPDWRMPNKPSKIESDVEDITKDIKDDIEDM